MEKKTKKLYILYLTDNTDLKINKSTKLFFFKLAFTYVCSFSLLLLSVSFQLINIILIFFSLSVFSFFSPLNLLLLFKNICCLKFFFCGDTMTTHYNVKIYICTFIIWIYWLHHIFYAFILSTTDDDNTRRETTTKKSRKYMKYVLA